MNFLGLKNRNYFELSQKYGIDNFFSEEGTD